MNQFKEILKKYKLYPELPEYEDLKTHLFFSKEQPSIQDLYNLCKEIHNRTLDLAIENGKIISETKYNDEDDIRQGCPPSYTIYKIDKQSIEKLIQPKEEKHPMQDFYEYGQSLNIKINDLQRLASLLPKEETKKEYLEPIDVNEELPNKDGYYFVDNLNELANSRLWFSLQTLRWYYDSSCYDESCEVFNKWLKPIQVYVFTEAQLRELLDKTFEQGLFTLSYIQVNGGKSDKSKQEYINKLLSE